MTSSYRIPPIASLLLMIFLSTTGTAIASDEIPGDIQRRPIALMGATLHPISRPPLRNATILFDEGQITAIGQNIDLPARTQVIDVNGKHIYPGLFNADGNLGLIEINSIRGTRDYQETGTINPNVRAEVAVNPDSELIPVTRSGGVLLTLTSPQGGLLSGTSAIIQLDGWTWEEMTLKAPVGLHVEWPRMEPASDWWVEESADEQNSERDESLAALDEAIDHARAYALARSAADSTPIDARWEAMQPVLTGDLPLIVRANELQQIQAAVAFADRHKLRLIIYGGYDVPHCAELIKEHNVPVIVAGVHRLPRRRGDDYDAAYTLPERLRQLEIPYCIAGTGRFNASNSRNLPFQAATAVAYGLPHDEALRAITLYPAQILGVEEHIGSLEIDKDATLIVTDGDPLEATTNILDAYIQGRHVDLSNRQTRLWEKYRERIRRSERDRDG